MRTITIQADKPLDAIMEQWLAHLVLAIPVGPDGITFDGDLYNGTTVNQRKEGQWTVSFRPNPDGSRRRAYANPHVVARVIIAREHETVTNLPAELARRRSWHPGAVRDARPARRGRHPGATARVGEAAKASKARRQAARPSRLSASKAEDQAP